MKGNGTVYKRKHNSHKKKCCFEDKKKMQKWLLVGFSTDLWQTFFTLSQRRRSEITRFSLKVLFVKVLRRALFMKNNLTFVLKSVSSNSILTVRFGSAGHRFKSKWDKTWRNLWRSKPECTAQVELELLHFKDGFG